jgi:phospholipase/carboxylesterase
MRREEIGGLNCIVSGPASGQPPEAVAVLCHGFGAPGTDLVPLGDVLTDRLGAGGDRVEFVFPAAPLSLDAQGIPGGRAWWPIDMVKLQLAMAMGEFSELRTEAPQRLPEMTGLLTQLVEDLCRRSELPKSRVILGGFSQGAMLATDAALRMPERPGGLIVWSGTLLNEMAWKQAATQGSALSVVQSHAVDDPILPYPGAEALRDMLTATGHSVDFLRFRGGHSIPEAAIGAAARLIGSVVSRSSSSRG